MVGSRSWESTELDYEFNSSMTNLNAVGEWITVEPRNKRTRASKENLSKFPSRLNSYNSRFIAIGCCPKVFISFLLSFIVYYDYSVYLTHFKCIWCVLDIRKEEVE